MLSTDMDTLEFLFLSNGRKVSRFMRGAGAGPHFHLRAPDALALKRPGAVQNGIMK